MDDCREYFIRLRVKMSFTMRELRHWYAKRLNVDPVRISFLLFDRIPDDFTKPKTEIFDHHTVASLNYDPDIDCIEGYVQKFPNIKLRMLSQPDKFYEFFVNIQTIDNIKKLREIYAQRTGEPVESLRLRYEGHKGPDLWDRATPKYLKMKNGDLINVYKCIAIQVKEK